MQVDQKLWQQTSIATQLSSFPGVLGEFLQETTPVEILRAEKFLPHIFWRWYMLEHSSHKVSPYHYLAWRREREHWPENGQFFPHPTLQITKASDPFVLQTTTPKVQIDITVEYIAFHEQPIIVDVINTLQRKSLQYNYDEQYRKNVQSIAAYLQTKGIKPSQIKMSPMLALKPYFEQSLSSWREKDPFINASFLEHDWLSFWKDVFQKASDKDGLSTDTLLDLFVDIVRNTHPDYGIKSADLEHVNAKGDISVHVKIQYFFWLSLAYYVLLPFSLFSHLLAPIFREQDMFHHDIEALLTEDFSEPMPIYAPFTTLTVTPFGKNFLRENPL